MLQKQNCTAVTLIKLISSQIFMILLVYLQFHLLETSIVDYILWTCISQIHKSIVRVIYTHEKSKLKIEYPTIKVTVVQPCKYSKFTFSENPSPLLNWSLPSVNLQCIIYVCLYYYCYIFIKVFTTLVTLQNFLRFYMSCKGSFFHHVDYIL